MAVDPASRHADPSQDAAVASPAEGAAGFLIGETPEKDPWAEGQHAPAIGPWKLAGRRLRRNKLALAFLGLFILLVVACLLAPFYSKHIAEIGPNTNNVTGTVDVRGHQENVVSLDGVPIGPTFTRHYFFGADTNGRDLAVRLLYGGRTSLLIGGVATLIIIVFGTLVGLLSGYLRGPVDAVLRWFMELIWSFPPVILGVVVGTALAFGGIGPIKGNSIFIPTLIIGGIYIPYLGKPIRGEVLRLREMDFVDAARVVGVSPWRIMFSEILPNAASTITVFVPIMLANTILLEAYLSFLGAGVQAPNASWGTLISDGLNYISTTPTFSLIPGAMLVLTVLSINVVGDGVRDALDPRAQVRIKT
jgi:peptide/nickel transport system permease protein